MRHSADVAPHARAILIMLWTLEGEFDNDHLRENASVPRENERRRASSTLVDDSNRVHGVNRENTNVPDAHANAHRALIAAH